MWPGVGRCAVRGADGVAGRARGGATTGSAWPTGCRHRREGSGDGHPGAIVGLSIPGRIDYTTAVGVADIATGVPLSAADHSRIGSVTKTFTGTAVLQLVDQGRIRLTDPIAMYVDGVPNGDRITLDMLGRMRSGLFNYSDDEAFQDRFFAEAPTGPDAFATTRANSSTSPSGIRRTSLRTRSSSTPTPTPCCWAWSSPG